MNRLLALSVFFLSSVASAATYNLQILQSLSGSGDSHAYALNDNGTVVGQSYNSTTGQNDSVIWNNGTATSIGTGIARGINNSGTVVGESGSQNLISPDGYAYSYTQVGGISYLGSLGGTYAGAYDINESGTIVGLSYTPAANLLQQQGFIYESGSMSSLGTVSSPTGYSRAHGINDAGQSVGRASTVDFNNSEKHMTYWDENQNLNFYDGATGNYSSASQINNSGIIAGLGRQAATGNTQYGMLWDNDGTLLNIFGDFTDGSKGSVLHSINDNGDVVGYGKDATGARRAMVSYDGTTMIDLNTVLDLTGTGFVSLDEAFDININGQIVGIGTLSDGSQGAFMINAVPVPAAVWLFGSALAGLGWMRRKVIA